MTDGPTGMFTTPPEADPELGEVAKVWYEDGDLAAIVYGNLALGVDTEDASIVVRQALEAMRRDAP